MLPSVVLHLLLEEVALDESEIHQLCVLHRAEGVDAVLGGQWQGRVESSALALVVCPGR